MPQYYVGPRLHQNQIFRHFNLTSFFRTNAYFLYCGYENTHTHTESSWKIVEILLDDSAVGGFMHFMCTCRLQNCSNINVFQSCYHLERYTHCTKATRRINTKQTVSCIPYEVLMYFNHEELSQIIILSKITNNEWSVTHHKYHSL